eukprot:XP_011666784.1 PREDICTED: 5'-nucleotidase-like [Strongylocentrotus purpuratus]
MPNRPPNDEGSRNLIFEPVIESVQAAVDALVDDHGVNKIIALSDSSFEIDQEIARSVQGVDIVIGGHPYTFLYTGDPPYDEEAKTGDYPLIIHPSYNDSLDIPVVSAYLFGKYLGYLEVTFDDEGAVTSYAGNPIVLDKDVAKDPEVLAEVEAWKVLVDATSNTVVGSADVELVGSLSVCGVGECSMGSMLTDSMRFAHGMGWDVDIAITSTGSFASSIDQGNITISDLTRTIPYGDTIDLLELTGESIIAILEKSVTGFETSSASTAFLQLSGAVVEYDLTHENGDRVLSVKLPCDSCDDGYEAIDVETVYHVAMNSYISGGQEGYTIILESTISRVRGSLDVDVAVSYLNDFSPIMASTSARIVIYDEENRPNASTMLTAPSLGVLLLVFLGSMMAFKI